MNCLSSMEMIFLILVFFVEGLWETEALSVTGEEGEKVTIKCSHGNAFSNIKYFCEGACKYEDVLIRSSETKTPNKKYSIRDEGNTFYVTISDLTVDDSRTYWCGVDRIGLDTYNEVVLTVTVGKKRNSDLTIETFSSSPNKLVYIRAGLGVAVFSLVMVTFLIILICGRRHIHASAGKDHDAKLSSQKQDRHHITTSPSTCSEAEETDGRTNSIYHHQDTSRVQTGNIYSNVTESSEDQIQPEALFYTTVSFDKHTECNTATHFTEAVIYSTITHKSTKESTHYCNV